MKIELREVHVGREIDKRRIELGLNKSGLGRRIGVPQQHINRMLARETMETRRLVEVSKALDYNFFTLFLSRAMPDPAYPAAKASDADTNDMTDGAELAVQLKQAQAEIKNRDETNALLRDQIESLKAQIQRLDANLRDKDAIIQLLKERR